MCLANSEAAVEGAIADIEGIVKRKGKKASSATDYAGKYF